MKAIQFAKLTMCALVAGALCITISGCAKYTPKVEDMNSGSKSANSLTGDPSATSAVPLFEYVGTLGSEEAHNLALFGETFNVVEIASLAYSRDNYEAIQTTDPQLIQKVFDALKQVDVVGEYAEDVFVTDSHSYFTFNMTNGTTASIHFDFGNLLLNDQLYACTNMETLNSAISELQNSAS